MNPTVVAMLLAAGLGAGVFMVARALRPRAVPLTETMASLQRPGTSYGTTNIAAAAESSSPHLQVVLGRVGARLMESLSFADLGVLRDQLRILDKSFERHAYEKLFGAIAGFALPNLAIGALAAGDVPINPLVGLGLGVVASAAGFFYPDLPLSEQVEKRQQGFRHALSSYLDLVTIILAGGGGTESALVGAAEAGEGWAFDEIRTALRRAELTGRTPWDLFDELGETLGVDELRELAASVALAGGHGAKIRQSLSAKSDALRAQLAAELEAAAENRTEKMIVPVTVMVIGLTLFIGYGAIDAISTDGGATFQPGTQIDTP